MLVEDEEKILGDIRYNTINLVKNKDLKNNYFIGRNLSDGTLAIYENPRTGQIFGASISIVLNNILGDFYKEIQSYIHYEIFQKDKRSDKENILIRLEICCSDFIHPLYKSPPCQIPKQNGVRLWH